MTAYFKTSPDRWAIGNKYQFLNMNVKCLFYLESNLFSFFGNLLLIKDRKAVQKRQGSEGTDKEIS